MWREIFVLHFVKIRQHTSQNYESDKYYYISYILFDKLSMQDTLQCLVALLQMEYLYRHYNASKNHALLFVRVLLEIVYT